MKDMLHKTLFSLAVAGALWVCNGHVSLLTEVSLSASAEARLGRPATPVSVAGVARRSTVRNAAYDGDVVEPFDDGIGGPASGIGVLPGAGAGRAGVGYSRGVGGNLGGPVNRVGVR